MTRTPANRISQGPYFLAGNCGGRCPFVAEIAGGLLGQIAIAGRGTSCRMSSSGKWIQNRETKRFAFYIINHIISYYIYNIYIYTLKLRWCSFVHTFYKFIRSLFRGFACRSWNNWRQCCDVAKHCQIYEIIESRPMFIVCVCKAGAVTAQWTNCGLSDVWDKQLADSHL
jgi:hypothetical protein